MSAQETIGKGNSPSHPRTRPPPGAPRQAEEGTDAQAPAPNPRGGHRDTASPQRRGPQREVQGDARSRGVLAGLIECKETSRAELRDIQAMDVAGSRNSQRDCGRKVGVAMRGSDLDVEGAKERGDLRLETGIASLFLCVRMVRWSSRARTPRAEAPNSRRNACHGKP